MWNQVTERFSRLASGRTAAWLGQLSLAGCLAWGSVAGAADQPAANVLRAPGKSGLSAVVLQSKTLTGAVVPHHHVILVDTSASQVGEHRDQALAVTAALMQKLPAADQVRLFAVDVKSEPLSKGFEAGSGAGSKAALAKLEQRTPLGATNMLAALTTALDSIPAGQPATVIYLGDGQSNAAVIAPKALQQLLQNYRERQVAITCYGVGPTLNLHLMGLLAHQTGGLLLLDQTGRATDEELARRWDSDRLVAAVTAPVFFPEEVSISAPVKLYPEQPLPVRLDRETVYVAKGTLPAAATLRLSRGAEGTDESTWELAKAEERPEFAFLAPFVSRMDVDGTWTNSLAGRDVMALAAAEHRGRVEALVSNVQQALDAKNPQQAAKIAQRLRTIDPRHPAVTKVSAKVKAAIRPVSKTRNLRQEMEDEEEDAPADEMEAEEGMTPEEGEEGMGSADESDDEATSEAEEKDPTLKPLTDPARKRSLLDRAQQDQRIAGQRLELEVSNTIKLAQSLQNDPGAALEELKRQLNVVNNAVEVDSDVRERLRKILQGTILRFRNLQATRDADVIRAQERVAQFEAQRRLEERAELEEKRLEALIDRVRALIEEGRHGDDQAYEEAEAVARTALSLRPQESASNQAVFVSEAAQQLNRSRILRARRADEFLEALHQTELAHIPVPDEPPIRFPSPETWRILTERRKKWKSVDLRKNSPNEDRMYSRLQETIKDDEPISFTDRTLRDVVTYLAETYDLQIRFKEDKLQEESINPDDTTKTVTITLSKVKLKTVFKLILRDFGLTYVLEDEIMQITTESDAQNSQSIRVYQVADLVIPPGAGGGQQGGQGFGGIGGGQGGGGGFGGQGGGGGFGGQGGGGGGGFFSVAPQPQADGNGPVAKKKRLTD